MHFERLYFETLSAVPQLIVINMKFIDGMGCVDVKKAVKFPSRFLYNNRPKIKTSKIRDTAIILLLYCRNLGKM